MAAEVKKEIQLEIPTPAILFIDPDAAETMQ
jgi:hypothetical protein